MRVQYVNMVVTFQICAYTEPHLNTRKVGRILESCANPQLCLGFALLSLSSSLCLDEAM